MYYYVFGDIHGQIKRLRSALEGIDYAQDGKIVFLGDYVDRGKDSRKVISLVKELVEANKAIAIRGNHDDMMVKCFYNPKNPDSLWWKDNYLKPTKNSYYTENGWQSQLYREHVDFLKGLPLVVETESFHFSHSGASEDFLWGRPKSDSEINGKYNVHGHTPLDNPYFGKNRANLDTGCAWAGGYLSVAKFKEGERIPDQVFQYG